MTAETVQTASARPIQRPRLQIGLAFVAFIVIGASDGALGVLLPSIQHQYGVDKATVSLGFLAGTLGYLCGAIATGPLSEKLGTRAFLSLGAIGFMVGAGAYAFTIPFLLLLLCIVPMGFGVAIIDAGLNAYIARLPENTALLNYLHAFYGMGALLGPAFATMVLVVGWVWNTVYATWIALGLFLLIAFLAFFTGSRTVHHTRVEEEGQAAHGNVVLAVLRLPLVWLAAGFLLVYVGAEVSLGAWSYSYLTQERHLAEGFSGLSVTGFWLGLTLGRLFLARLAVRLGDRRLIEVCLAGVVAGVLVAWLAPWALPSVGLWLAGFALGPIFPTTIAILSRTVPRRLISSAIGLVASFGSIGAALFPWIAGNLAQWAGELTRSTGLWTLMPYVAVLTAVLLVLWVALSRNRSSGRPAEA